MTLWAIAESAANKLQAGQGQLVPRDFKPTAYAGAQVSGGVARIEISGVLTPSPDPWAEFFGEANTAYGDIIAAIQSAASDSRVKSVDYVINSPGGTIDGLFETVDAMQALGKPSRAVVTGMAASAAYALAAQADTITATGAGSAVGSIGVVQRFYVDPSRVAVTSRAAPNKAPDPTTEEGRAVIQDQLDQYHTLYAQSIADGRGVSVEKVNTEYGQGGIYLADLALKRGMIDAVASVKPAAGGTSKGKKAMTLAEIMAAHPEAYAAAVQVGIDQERDRVTAHLTMGEASNALDTAHAAIKAGDGMTATRMAEYQATALRVAIASARVAETQNTPATTTPAADPAADPKAEGSQVPRSVFAAAATALGLEVTNA